MSNVSYQEINTDDIVFGEVGHTNVNNMQFVRMNYANGKLAFWLTKDKTKPAKNLFGLKPPYGVEDQIKNAQATGQKDVVDNLLKKDDAICFEVNADQEAFFLRMDEKVKRVAVKNFDTWFPSKANAKGYEKEEKRKEYVEENYISRLSKYKDSMDKSGGKDVAKFSNKEDYMAFRKRKYNIMEEDLPEDEKKRFLRVSVPKGKYGTAFEVIDWDQAKDKFKGKPRPATCVEDKPAKEGGHDHVIAFLEFKQPNTIWFGSMGFGLNLVLRHCLTVKGMSRSSVSAGDMFGFESASEDEDEEPAPKNQKPTETAPLEWNGDSVCDPNAFDPGDL